MGARGPQPLEDGRETRGMSVRIASADRDLLVKLANDEGISMAMYIGRALEAHLAEVTGESK